MSVLIITSKDDVTVDFIVKELKERKSNYYRLNTDDLPKVVSIHFDINNNTYEVFDRFKNKRINLLSFDSVYFRRPEISNLNHIIGINNQELNYLRNELLYVFEGIYKILRNKYWLNNVFKIREAENKIYQLQVAQDIGFQIPDSLVSNQHDKIASFYNYNQTDCIVKPIKTGNMKDLEAPKVIFTTKINSELINLNPERIESFPVLMQDNIKKIYDLRITVVGNDVYTAQIHSQNDIETSIDWRKGDKVHKISKHNLPSDIKNKCILITKQLSLSFSAIDMVIDEKYNYVFLEVNPNGQWAWIEKRLGLPISKSIVNLLIDKGGSYEQQANG